MISDENRQRALQAFGVVYRRKAKSIMLKVGLHKFVELDIGDLKKTYMGLRSLRHGASVFYDDNTQKFSEPDDAKLLKDLIADETLAKAATIEIQNSFLFKTPLNVVLASHEPERKFIRALTQLQWE